MPQMLLSLAQPSQKIPGVDQTEYKVERQDGAQVSIFRFAKTSTSSSPPGPAVLHMHGGGMIMGSVVYQVDMISEYVAKTDVQIFSVEYRLAPEHSGTTPVEDCYASLLWLRDHADEFNVDRARIAVMGESAGGGLAASLAILARDRGLSPPIAKQILLAPMLDHRNTRPVEGMDSLTLWTSGDNATGWKALLGERAEDDDVSPYISSARVKTVAGLPSTYIDVGGLDIFRDEVIEYARRTAAANIDTEIHVYSGLPHSFEFFGSSTPVTARAFENRYGALRSI